MRESADWSVKRVRSYWGEVGERGEDREREEEEKGDGQHGMEAKGRGMAEEVI